MSRKDIISDFATNGWSKKVSMRNTNGKDAVDADKEVKICPVCYSGWEIVKINNIKSKINFYGNWKNVARGKEKKICLKCE
tara:strand:- start:9057 stop:9299 length:243 start_codon:yes stop_codon:yes gene_type:complete